jgi:antitoxin (DNA-binding transcriptional repressor) of toxin-antitoxin stability system
MKVGTKELKNRLSHYVRLVQQGEPVQVTDPRRGRGRAFREAERSDEACLQALEQQGLVTIGSKKRLSAFQPLVPRGKKLLSEMVIEDRG